MPDMPEPSETHPGDAYNLERARLLQQLEELDAEQHMTTPGAAYKPYAETVKRAEYAQSNKEQEGRSRSPAPATRPIKLPPTPVELISRNMMMQTQLNVKMQEQLEMVTACMRAEQQDTLLLRWRHQGSWLIHLPCFVPTKAWP